MTFNDPSGSLTDATNTPSINPHNPYHPHISTEQKSSNESMGNPMKYGERLGHLNVIQTPQLSGRSYSVSIALLNPSHCPLDLLILTLKVIHQTNKPRLVLVLMLVAMLLTLM